MSVTQKNIIDDIKNLLSKFNVTDEDRLNNLWLPFKIDETRAQMISQRFRDEDIIDPAWLSDLSTVSFYKVNISDDPNVSGCGCPVSKAYIPQLINLPTKSVNQDLGIYSIMSLCGKTNYSYRSITQWRMIPSEHTYSLFRFYARINTALYVNADVEQLRIIALLASPEDGYFIKSDPIASGSIVSGTDYIVKFGSIVYNSVVYNDGDTFTGTSATAYSGAGIVYLASQKAEYRDTYPYPISADMARQITIEICTKEFGIERSQISDVRNDSRDDVQKS